MTIRVAVAASRYGDPWDEQQALVSRLAGALACGAEVDVLIPNGTREMAAWDGACRLLRFPAHGVPTARSRTWRRTIPSGRRRERTVPDVVEEQIVRAEGADSPRLYEHLRDTPYDLTIFVGFNSPVTCWGVRALPEGRRMMLVPGGRDDDALWLRIHDATFERAERVLVCTDSERAWVEERLGPGGGSRLQNIGFLVGVNRMACTGELQDAEDGAYLVVARDWNDTLQVDHFVRWARQLEERLRPELRFRLVGPRAEQVPYGVEHTASRLDAWRWMCRATAVLDPTPHRLVGREVLEAMLFGIPVIVHASGDASREHAEVGNGGLWYRTDDELLAVARKLLDPDLRHTLGEQGRRYAQERYADTDSYVSRVTDTLLV